MLGHEADYAGVEGRFTITRSGVDLFSGPDPWVAVTADLSNPASVTPGDHRVAIDPDLGRFRIASPQALAGDLRVTFHVLNRATVGTQVAELTNPAVLARLGRADDPIPAGLDVRAPRAVTDPVGRSHFDNLGVFATPARVSADRRPAEVTGSGQFTFDDTTGLRLQLLDGTDGVPLTRSILDSGPALFAGTPRGFAIRVNGVDVTDPAFQPPVRVLAADLTDYAHPRHPGGAAFTPAPTDITVDPQLGRLLLNRAALGAAADGVRVDYLTAPATFAAGVPAIPAQLPEVRALSLELVDGFDGTPIRVATRLGVPLAEFHGTGRGWRVHRNGADITAQFTPALADTSTPVAAGQLAIDPERGLLRFPPGTVTAADTITVDLSHPDRAAQAQRFDSLAQRLPKVVPAGVVPVVVDTRRPIVGR
jgi:hypothetical protein